MTKRILLTVTLIGLSQLLSSAQSTVEFMAGVGQRNVVLDADMPVPDGNYVSIGYFNPSFDVSGNLDDVSLMFSAWNEYGNTTIQTIFDQPGRFSSSASSTDPKFDNQQIWMWIFKTSDNANPLADFSNLQGYGLFSSTTNNWRFPAQGTLPPQNLTTVSSLDVDVALFGRFDSQHLYLNPAIIVPEPSTNVLIVASLGVLWLMVARRGKRKVS